MYQATGALRSLEELLEELAGVDEVSRRRGIHTVIRALVETNADAVTRQEYRDGFAVAKQMSKKDFDSGLREAIRASTPARIPPINTGSQRLDQLYKAGEDGCLYYVRPDGNLSRIATFVPRVVAEVIRDDGVERTMTFRVRVELSGGGGGETDVAPARLGEVQDWAPRAAGHRAVVLAGQGARDHVRTAAQLLAPPDLVTQTVYTHTGWGEIGERYLYLTASGGIGADGLMSDVTVDLGGPLAGYQLPDPMSIPVADLRAAIRHSVELLDLAPDSVMTPLLGAGYRATLPIESDGSVHLYGPPETGKSEAVALCQQHFGADMHAKNLPGTWATTANALAEQAFVLKDALFAVDDYAPTGTPTEIQKMNQAADRLFRGAANRAGRGRLDSDSKLRVTHPPRAQILSTGEDLPPGQSLRSRLFAVALSPGEMKWSALSECQRRGREGVYASAMAGFVRWLVGRRDNGNLTPESLREQHDALRETATAGGQQRRTPGLIASLAQGWRVWLDYAISIQALTSDEAEMYYKRAWTALVEGADAQAEAQQAMEPTQIYLDALRAALVAGHVHVTNLTGELPSDPKAWGWTYNPRFSDGGAWQPDGDRIGWLDEDNIYLEPAAAYNAAKRWAQTSGAPLTVSEATLRKRLSERGYLATTESPHLTIRKTVDVARRLRVLHLRAATLGVVGGV